MLEVQPSPHLLEQESKKDIQLACALFDDNSKFIDIKSNAVKKIFMNYFGNNGKKLMRDVLCRIQSKYKLFQSLVFSSVESEMNEFYWIRDPYNTANELSQITDVNQVDWENKFEGCHSESLSEAVKVYLNTEDGKYPLKIINQIRTMAFSFTELVDLRVVKTTSDKLEQRFTLDSLSLFKVVWFVKTTKVLV
jgi:hypothetical protein